MTPSENIIAVFRYFYVVGYCLEIRILGASGKSQAWHGFAGGMASGYFDNEAAFVKACIKLDQAHFEAAYVTMNPVRHDLIARANNRIIGLKKGDPTTKDEDIEQRRWMLIDVDPRRPKGISSTDEEIQAAREVALKIKAELEANGWCGIPQALSGNGIHLLARIDLPNDEQSHQLLRDFYAYLSDKYTDDKCIVDPAVHNAARVTKLYGTVARKGDPTPTRPHRRSTFLELPAEIQPYANFDFVPAQPERTPAARQPERNTDDYALIESILQKCPPHFGDGSYETWLSALMAVHSAIGDAGIDLCERYIPGAPGEVAAKFASFNGAGVGLGTLVEIGKKFGWQWPAGEYADDYDKDGNYAGDYDGFGPGPDETEITAVFTGKRGDLPFDIYEYMPEDGGILDAWLDYHADSWLYFSHQKTWHYWASTHWKPDRNGGIEKEIQWLLKAINLDAASKDEKRAEMWFRASKRSAGRINSVVEMAQPHRGITADMVNSANQLNLQNGVLDLDTCTFREHSPEDVFTYVLPYNYDPGASCARWEQFITEIIVEEDGAAHHEATAQVLQEFTGYCLTNQTNHESMLWLSGAGANGKSVYVAILRSLLGELCTSIDFQQLGLPGNYELADLAGMRVAFSTESERGGKTSEALIKRIVSGEIIKGRHIHSQQFEFPSLAKIVWSMNDKPVIKDTTNSMWRRMILIPFNRTFAKHEQDIHLIPKLRKELPGILNWAIDGWKRLRQQDYFTQSTLIDEAVSEYAEEANPVRQWITQRCERTSDPQSAARTLYEDYKVWIEPTGSHALTETNFGRELKKLGIGKEKRSTGSYYALALSDDYGLGL